MQQHEHDTQMLMLMPLNASYASSHRSAALRYCISMPTEGVYRLYICMCVCVTVLSRNRGSQNTKYMTMKLSHPSSNRDKILNDASVGSCDMYFSANDSPERRRVSYLINAAPVQLMST
eukprot:15091-Heterococcus_DN1.PRE.2